MFPIPPDPRSPWTQSEIREFAMIHMTSFFSYCLTTSYFYTHYPLVKQVSLLLTVLRFPIPRTGSNQHAGIVEIILCMSRVVQAVARQIMIDDRLKSGSIDDDCLALYEQCSWIELGKLMFKSEDKQCRTFGGLVEPVRSFVFKLQTGRIERKDFETRGDVLIVYFGLVKSAFELIVGIVQVEQLKKQIPKDWRVLVNPSFPTGTLELILKSIEIPKRKWGDVEDESDDESESGEGWEGGDEGGESGDEEDVPEVEVSLTGCTSEFPILV